MKNLWILSFLGVILVGCSSKKPLEGKRMDVPLQDIDFAEIVKLDKSPVIIDKSQINLEFTQPMFNSTHYYMPLEFSKNFKTLWVSDLDFESTKRIQVLSSAIVAEGKVFCLDAGGILYAFDKNNGKSIWRKSTTLKGKDGQIGGAIAYDNGMLIVTTSFAEAFSFNAATGDIIWRIKLSAPCKGDGITINNGKVYLLCDNSTLQVIDIKTGETIWSHSGMNIDTTFAGSSGVAVKDNIVYLTYPSGEIYALLENGTVLWSTILSRFSFVDALKSLSHPRACPVVCNNLVYITSANQQLVAYNIQNGSIVWKANVGGLYTPVVSGNSIFVCDLNNEVTCLNKDTGIKKWSKNLSTISNNWMGPLLTTAGLILISDNGKFVILSVKDGTIQRVEQLEDSGEGINVLPVIADRIMYLPMNSGKLVAYK